jgi:hypothetical protein
MRMSQPGPEGQRPPAARWRWPLPLGVTAVIFTLLTLPLGAAPGMVLSYSGSCPTSAPARSGR